MQSDKCLHQQHINPLNFSRSPSIAPILPAAPFDRDEASYSAWYLPNTLTPAKEHLFMELKTSFKSSLTCYTTSAAVDEAHCNLLSVDVAISSHYLLVCFPPKYRKKRDRWVKELIQ